MSRADSPLDGTRRTGRRERRTGRAVRDYMTPRDALATVSPDATLREVAEVLSSRHVAGAPVLAGSDVVGVVSASDLMEFAATTPAVSLGEEEPDVAQLWEEWDGAPGADEGGDARADFLSETWMSEGEQVAERFASDGRADANVFEEHTAAEVMTTRLVTISPGAELREAAELMRHAGVHRLLVMEDGRLLGMITSTDVLRAVTEG